MPKGKCLKDKVFGKLRVLREFGKNKHGKTIWVCECACGNDNFLAIASPLINGKTRSCGCIRSLPKLEYYEKTKSRITSSIVYENGCWVWQKNVRANFPHGVMGWNFNKKKGNWQAHRVAYTIWKGDIPEGMFVLHSCDNPRCVNPDHLHLGTQKDNMIEMRERGRARDEVRGRKGVRHHKAKLTDDQVREIRRLKKLGVSGLELARTYNVTNPLIYGICNNKIWTHVV